MRVEYPENGADVSQPYADKARVADVLREVKDAQIMRQMEFGPAWQDTGFVFTRLDCRSMDPAKVTKTFTQVMKNASMPGVHLHDLRHTHASLMLRMGVRPKAVSERLGHADVSIMLDTYSHFLPGVQEEATERVSKVLRKGD